MNTVLSVARYQAVTQFRAIISCNFSLFTAGFSTDNTTSTDKTMAYNNIGDMRKPYKNHEDSFTEEQLVSTSDPYLQFDDWFKKAKNTPEILEPNAMCLATCDKNGSPSARFVLLKGYGSDIDGFTFFTNYASRKGKELEMNPQAALAFYWDKLNRQIRIEGSVNKVPESENDHYFHRRPLASQIGAAASEQSTVIESRQVLIDAANKIAATCNGEVEKPKNWGGYLLTPNKIEFWQGQTDRLHDRIIFERNEQGKGWKTYRLAP